MKKQNKQMSPKVLPKKTITTLKRKKNPSNLRIFNHSPSVLGNAGENCKQILNLLKFMLLFYVVVYKNQF